MPFLEHQFESLLPKPFLKKKMNRADLLFINILQQPTTHTQTRIDFIVKLLLKVKFCDRPVLRNISPFLSTGSQS